MVFILKEYSYREGDKILQKLIQTEDKQDKYVLTNHIKKQACKRGINISYLENMLLNEEPLGVLSSRKNRFKVFYPSEINPKQFDLIIVIAIDDDEKIVGVTTYEDAISHREGIEK